MPENKGVRFGGGKCHDPEHGEAQDQTEHLVDRQAAPEDPPDGHELDQPPRPRPLG